MDVNTAMAAHKAWLQKFRVAIDERQELDADTICLDNKCELGQWLHGDAKDQFGGHAFYEDTVDVHAKFHLQAAEVAKLINNHQFREASDQLKSGAAYQRATNLVLQALVKFKIQSAKL
ncbi:CZB domain-containing protein [Celeribacter litoreus]|uniref:CZB domain-containing protein n=1 Tax=Celeribacter litoreus TaxID=2876714 RepID=UPI001CC9F95B|nr:CZB domain-containing protein [Celeribacter litoreus]MCA0041901.1 CZB domain-containing protein [Celeribacter litoreus]